MNEEKNYKEKLMEMYVKGELPVLKRNLPIKVKSKF